MITVDRPPVRYKNRVSEISSNFRPKHNWRVAIYDTTDRSHLPTSTALLLLAEWCQVPDTVQKREHCCLRSGLLLFHEHIMLGDSCIQETLVLHGCPQNSMGLDDTELNCLPHIHRYVLLGGACSISDSSIHYFGYASSTRSYWDMGDVTIEATTELDHCDCTFCHWIYYHLPCKSR